MSVISESAGIFLASDLTQGVRFQLWPDSIDDEKSVNWAAVDVIGRSEPIMTYHSSTSQRFGFTLMFAASVDGSDRGSPEFVKKKVDFLKALTYPQKSKAGYTTFPPPVILVVGDLIDARCVVNSVHTSWEGPWDLRDIIDFEATVDDFAGNAGVPGLAVRQNLATKRKTKPIVSLPIIAKVKIELSTAHLTPLDFETVMKKGDRTGSGQLPGTFDPGLL